jgi:hypothetical protein
MVVWSQCGIFLTTPYLGLMYYFYLKQPQWYIWHDFYYSLLGAYLYLHLAGPTTFYIYYCQIGLNHWYGIFSDADRSILVVCLMVFLP